LSGFFLAAYKDARQLGTEITRGDACFPLNVSKTVVRNAFDVPSRDRRLVHFQRAREVRKVSATVSKECREVAHRVLVAQLTTDVNGVGCASR